MCLVSYIGDQYREKWYPQQDRPTIEPFVWPNNIPSNGPTLEQFNQLKKEVEELKTLLSKAKIYDQQTNQPDCEMEDKIAVIKRVADLVGVDLGNVFAK
jgi:hypothetical protein